MAPKEELQQLVHTLSDYECKCLLNVVRDVAAGERFWEGDFGHLYNEYVKLRYFKLPRNRAAVPPISVEGSFVPVPITKSYANADRVPLPSPEPPSRSLADTLMNRRSRRDYSGKPIAQGQLSTLLGYACGATGLVQAYNYTKVPLRTFPSHGGLQSSEIYLSVRAVKNVPAGIYHYEPVDHALEVIKRGDYSEALRTVAFDERFFETASVVFLITGCYERLKWKYGERSYRFICIDSGLVCENIYLVSEALGLGVCAVSGFAQDGVEDLFGIDGKNEMAMVLTTLGVRVGPDESKEGV
jgi:SagB-type dehydrogenase family enzyme